jgi:hypothetical protein
MKNLVLLPQNQKKILFFTLNIYTPKHAHNHEIFFVYPSPLLPPLTYAFAIEHIFLKIANECVNDVVLLLNKLNLA